MTSKKTYTRPDTVLAVSGRDPDNNFGIVNPPVYHASTILSPTMDKFENRIPFEGYGYGRGAQVNPKGPAFGPYGHVIRGGSYREAAHWHRTAARRAWPYASREIGFRCAYDVKNSP